MQSPKLSQIFYKIGKKPTKPKSFADDTILITQFKNDIQIHELKLLLSRLEESIGLHINFGKTKILTHGTFPAELSSLGTIVNKMKHLGIIISFDQELARDSTYDELCVKLEKRAKSIPLRSGYNLIKRRNLCSAIMSSSAFHVYRIYPPSAKYCKKLWKISRQFLWSVRNPDGNISYRYKISQNRIELDYTCGGLNFLKPETQSFSIWINSFMNCLKYSAHYPDCTIGLIFSHRHVSINSLLPNFGFKTLTKNQNVFKSIYPCNGGEYFNKATEFFNDIEKDKVTSMHTPIVTSSFSNIYTQFSLNDERALKRANKLTIASILETRNIGSKWIFLPKLKSDLEKDIDDNTLLIKLLKLVDLFKPFLPFESCYSQNTANK